MRGFLLILAFSALACSAGTITSGTALYNSGAVPSAQNGNPNVDFKLHGATSIDHLVSNWWFYRVGTERERPFGSYSKTPANNGSISTLESSPSGNSLRFNITESNNTGTRFTAVLAYTMTGAPNGAWAQIEMSLQINNPRATSLTATFFNYLNADLNETATDDSAVLASANSIRVTDGSSFTLYHTAPNPSAYRVEAASSLLTSLQNGTQNNLTTGGLPFGPGNFTSAFQWNVTVPANGSTTIQSLLRLEEAVPPQEVPEPSCLLPAGIGLIAFALARLRTSPSAKPAGSSRRPQSA